MTSSNLDGDQIAEAVNQLLGVQLSTARTISQANMLEGMIDAYIADFYTRCPTGDYLAPYLAFRWDVLANRNITLNTKIDILFKTYKRVNPANATKRYRKNYTKWLEIRNKFAHGSHVGGQEGDELFYGGEFLDAQKLADEFMTLQQKIMNHMGLYNELRGPYFNNIPKKRWEKKK